MRTVDETEENLMACPDCDRPVAIRLFGPDANGPVRLLLAEHQDAGRECAGSERVYVQGDHLVSEALRRAVRRS